MKKRTHFTRYVVLHTYELRQGWKRFKAEAAQLWLYWRFRAKYSVGRSGGREEKGDFEPLTDEQYAVLSKAAPAQRGKTVSSLLDPNHDHLFTAEAAHKAFAHRKPLETNMTTPAERTRAVLHTKLFLEDLLSPARMPEVPEHVSEEARTLLRHYPGPADLAAAHRGASLIWGPPQTSRKKDDRQR